MRTCPYGSSRNHHGDGGSDPSVPLADRGQISAQRVGREQAGRRDRHGLHDDQAGPTPGSRLLVGDKVLGRQMLVDQRGLVRGRHHPAGQLHGPHRQRAEQPLAPHRPTVLHYVRHWICEEVAGSSAAAGVTRHNIRPRCPSWTTRAKK